MKARELLESKFATEKQGAILCVNLRFRAFRFANPSALVEPWLNSDSLLRNREGHPFHHSIQEQ